MRTRIIAGLIAIPIVVIPIYLGGFWGLLLGVAATTIGAWELFHMFKAGGYHPSLWIGMPWAILIFMAGWDPQQVQQSSISITGLLTQPTIWLVETFSFPLQTVLTAGLIITLIYCLFVVDKPVNTWMSTSIGAIYLGILLGQIVALRFLDNGFWYVLFGFLVTWANDTAAYFTGVTIGRRKLWPRLSPKKTWEGTIGGWIGAAAAGALLAWLFPLEIGPLFGAGVGFLGRGPRPVRRPLHQHDQAPGGREGQRSHLPRPRRPARSPGQHAVHAALHLSGGDLVYPRRPIATGESGLPPVVPCHP